MKTLQILLAAIFLTACFSTARAQLCGKWTFAVSVFNRSGAPVKNAKVKFKNAPAGDAASGRQFKKSDGAPNVYKVEFSEGEKVLGKYKIKIFAEGYTNSTQAVEFEYCRSSVVRVVLAAARR